MPRLKVLSGGDVIAILATFGFVEESRRGSHVKLRRFGPSGERQILIVPNHAELAKELCGRSIVNLSGTSKK